MKARPAWLLAVACLFAACQSATVESTGRTAEPIAPTAGADQIPAGTTLEVTLQDALSTKTNAVGDPVEATVTTPVRDASGAIVVPSGSVVEGRVTGLADSPRVGEPAVIRIDFNRLQTRDGEVPITADITSAKPEVSSDLGRAGKGAAIGGAGGAALGAILGRSLTGALVGGLLGAGAGTAISLGTGDVPASLPAGTPMTLRLTQGAPIG